MDTAARAAQAGTGLGQRRSAGGAAHSWSLRRPMTKAPRAVPERACPHGQTYAAGNLRIYRDLECIDAAAMPDDGGCGRRQSCASRCTSVASGLPVYRWPRSG